MVEPLGDRRLNMEALRQRLRQVGTPRPLPARPTGVTPPPGDTLSQAVGGHALDGCHVVSAQYEPTHQHGAIPLGELWHCRGQTLATLAKDPTLHRFDFRRTLFLDTETNGLAGGAGTYAFLVGVAFWEGDRFQVRQFFMRHPGEEQALLAHLTPLFDRYESFVTFNGKSFDLPVLESRFILARQPRTLRRRPHLDLLHPARRLWKERLDSCSLGTLEQRILGLGRDEADVPGYLIPHLYNEFLRDGNPAPMRGIFYHNHQDLLALATLAVHMARLCEDPAHHAAPHGQDHLALARLFEDDGQWARAEQCYRHALRAPIPPSLRRDGMRRLSFLLKRQGRWEEATTLWRELLDTGELYPYEELAKYYEHQRRDPAAAQRAVQAAWQAAQAGALRLAPRDRDALRHRDDRLRRKLARQQEEER